MRRKPQKPETGCRWTDLAEFARDFKRLQSADGADDKQPASDEATTTPTTAQRSETESHGQ